MTLARKEYYLFIVALIVLQALIAFQGFDFCDEGFSLTFYQQFFHAPESVEYIFVYWLSGLFGGIWYELNPLGGIVWFRLLAIAVNTLTVILGFNILKRFIDRRLALLGLTMVLFANDFGFLVFYHNHLTALLVLLSIYLLFKGVSKGSKWFVLLGGLIIAVNYTTRIPNLTMTSLVLAIPFAYYLRVIDKKRMYSFLLYFGFGIILGLGFIGLLLLALDQIEIMQNAISSLFSLGRTSDSAHGLLFLIKVTLGNYKKVVVITGVLVLLFVIISYLKGLKHNKLISLSIQMILIFIISGLITFGKIHFIYALGIIGSLSVIANKQEPTMLRVITLMGGLMLVCLPLGSGGGMVSSGTMCIWLALPLGLHFLFNYGLDSAVVHSKLKAIPIAFDEKTLKSIGFITIACFLIIKSYSISQRAYFDHGPRWKKAAKVNSQFTTALYTTLQRAEIANNILMGLEEFVKPGDYLFAYDKIPMLHFLTETKPYLYNPWPWIYNGELFSQKLLKAEETIEELPVIVQQKFETIYELSQPMTDYLDESRVDNERFNQSRTKAFNAFLERNNYEVVWSNNYFNIYKPLKRN